MPRAASPPCLTLYDDAMMRAAAQGLLVMGALHPRRVGARDLEGGTLLLLGAGPGFWDNFRRAPEAGDGAPDPIDRWSRRVVGALAEALGARALYPFGGPPHAPFVDWALKSGRAFQSPTGMLVHDTVGLMISYRGALHFPREEPIPAVRAPTPCDSCAGRPCTTACPVGALSGARPYALAACHAYLDTPAGADCMTRGCAVRRACPLSDGAARRPDQSALHMKAFHPPCPAP